MKTKVLLSLLIIKFGLNAQDIAPSVAVQLGCAEYQIKYKSNEQWTYCDCISGKRQNGNIPTSSKGAQILLTKVSAIRKTVKNASASELSVAKEQNPTIEGGGILCGSMVLKVKSDYKQYQWYRNGLKISNQTSKYLNINSLGNYYCEVVGNWITTGTKLVSNTIVINKQGNEVPVFTITSDSLTPVKSSKLNIKDKIDLSKISFQWYKEDSSTIIKSITKAAPIKNAIKSEYRTSRSGVYSLYLSNSTGCVKKSSNEIKITITPRKRGRADLQTDDELISNTSNNDFYYNIYPNPVKSSVLHIETNNNEGINNALIYNNLGQKVFEGEITNQLIENIDLTNGTYILRIFDKSNNELHTQFIEINKF